MKDWIYQGLLRLEQQFFEMQPPQWLLEEGLAKAILFVNHVLLQEPQALERIKRQQNKFIEFQWRRFEWRLRLTAAGLVESISFDANSNDALNTQAHLALDVPKKADLRIECLQASLVDMVQAWREGEKPPLRIEGDVQLAAEVNWLMHHVKWNYEDDLARVLGDVNAYRVGRVFQMVQEALKRFVQKSNDWRASSRSDAVHGVQAR
jgi:ubiquinone biosynthesis protein UbiJ